jgi:hypothetical protein
MSIRGLHVYTGVGYKQPTLNELNAIASMNVSDINIIVGTEKFIYGKNESTVTTNCVNALTSFFTVFAQSAIADMPVWISVPMYDYSSTTAIDNAPKLYPAYQNYIQNIQTALGSFWDYNVRGIYFHTETVHPVYQRISASSPTTNPTVKLMNDLGYWIRYTVGKLFMWCPYYGYGPNRDNIIYNVGVVANRTAIFDIICLQPAYYFQAGNNCDEYNLLAVDFSAADNVVYDRTTPAQPIAGGRSASAIARIGVNMEADANAVDPSKPQYERFQQYKSLYGWHVNTAPIMFYGGPTSVTTTTLREEITNFYGQYQ